MHDLCDLYFRLNKLRQLKCLIVTNKYPLAIPHLLHIIQMALGISKCGKALCSVSYRHRTYIFSCFGSFFETGFVFVLGFFFLFFFSCFGSFSETAFVFVLVFFFFFSFFFFFFLTGSATLPNQLLFSLSFF